MSTRYEKQIEKLVAYVKRLNQTVEERNQQLHYWQGYARKLREERQRLAQAMMNQVRRVLGEVAGRYDKAREEIRKQGDYIDHFADLSRRKEIALQNQLRYALSRIDDLSLERKAYRQEISEYKRRTWDAETIAKNLTGGESSRIRELESALEAALASNRHLAAELSSIHEQVAIQEAQWEELARSHEATQARLGETEAHLERAQNSLSETLASQTLSTAREVDDLRALVVSLQQQTEALRTEIRSSQEAMNNQERFIALLKQGEKPQVHRVPRHEEAPPPDTSEEDGPTQSHA
jgi:predicted  nucleic acid-binding Zn-ribbon protein